MSDTRVFAPRATEVLKSDHATVKGLFRDYEKLGGGAVSGKQRLFDRLKKELEVHAAIEEEIFYPAVAELGEEKDAEETVREALEEHKIVRTLLAELSGLGPEDEAFDAKMKVLSENVEHHADEEEDEMFPLFGKLDKEKRDEVSEAIRERKIELSGETPEK